MINYTGCKSKFTLTPSAEAILLMVDRVRLNFPFSISFLGVFWVFFKMPCVQTTKVFSRLSQNANIFNRYFFIPVFLEVIYFSRSSPNIKIDPALMRKGWMVNRYEFKELDVHKALFLAEKHGLPYRSEAPITIGDFFNSIHSSNANELGKKKKGL